jgi:hypothetical protein
MVRNLLEIEIAEAGFARLRSQSWPCGVTLKMMESETTNDGDDICLKTMENKKI